MGNERLCPGRLDVATSAPRPGRVKRPRHDGWALPGAPQQRCRPAPVNAFLQRHQDEGSHCNQVQWLSASSPRESQWPAGLQPSRRGSRRGLAKTARLGPSPKGVGWQARTGVRVAPTYPYANRVPRVEGPTIRLSSRCQPNSRRWPDGRWPGCRPQSVPAPQGTDTNGSAPEAVADTYGRTPPARPPRRAVTPETTEVDT
jgi:hypothetical protein